MPRLTPEQRDELRRARYNSLMAKVAEHAGEFEEQWLRGELPARQARHGQMAPPSPGFTPRPSVEHAGTPPKQETLTPGARAIAAAYELHREGKPVTVRAACLRARVDRANLRKNYPEAITAIELLSRPDRTPPGAAHDRRTNRFDAVDDLNE